ncbi:serine protease [Allokutzneria multivorans]|uniref:Serine protease n=1 Tax=Allokutzneria multivorans TaxID=1142134 RepID=A0ABP7TIQ8_9PSEU
MSTPPAATRSRRRVLGIALAAVSLAALVPTVVVGLAAANEPVEEVHADPFVVGGQRAAVGQFPGLVYLVDRLGSLYCGGALLTPTKVLTAAHCVDQRSAAGITVVSGREDTETRAGQSSRGSKSWQHPSYRSVFEGDDLGVLTLETPILAPTATLVAPGERASYAPGTEAVVAGWGATSETGSVSRYLMSATVPVMEDATCSRSYRSYNPKKMFCAGYDGGRVDSCQGDSGGPLLVRGVVVGVTSWGDGCARAGKPGVYVRLTTYLDTVRAQL